LPKIFYTPELNTWGVEDEVQVMNEFNTHLLKLWGYFSLKLNCSIKITKNFLMIITIHVCEDQDIILFGRFHCFAIEFCSITHIFVVHLYKTIAYRGSGLSIYLTTSTKVVLTFHLEAWLNNWWQNVPYRKKQMLVVTFDSLKIFIGFPPISTFGW
jgi:hypothetical protein